MTTLNIDESIRAARIDKYATDLSNDLQLNDRQSTAYGCTGENAGADASSPRPFSGLCGHEAAI